MSTIRRIFFVIVSAALSGLVFACGPIVQPKASGEVIYADDFSSISNQWDYWHDISSSAASVHKGKFLMVISNDNSDIFSTTPYDVPDVHLQTVGRKVFGGDDNVYGLVCRYMDNRNHYGFLISSDGYWAIVKRIDGMQRLLGSQTMAYHEGINQRETENVIEAVCAGNTLTLHVNGQKLAEVEDDTFQSGKFGLTSGSFTLDGEQVIEFDNFIAMAP